MPFTIYMQISVFLMNCFQQFRALLDRFPQLDWLHVFCAIDAHFSHRMRVMGAFYVQAQL